MNFVKQFQRCNSPYGEHSCTLERHHDGCHEELQDDGGVYSWDAGGAGDSRVEELEAAIHETLRRWSIAGHAPGRLNLDAWVIETLRAAIDEPTDHELADEGLVSGAAKPYSELRKELWLK